jgi:hypothetical protein
LAAIEITYFREIEQKRVRREGPSGEEHVRHPALLVVPGDILVREDVDE